MDPIDRGLEAMMREVRAGEVAAENRAANVGGRCGDPRCARCNAVAELEVELSAAELIAEHRGDVTSARAAGYFGGASNGT